MSIPIPEVGPDLVVNTVSSADILPIIEAIENEIQGKPLAHVLPALLCLAVVSVRPTISNDSLAQAVQDLSQLIAELSEESDVTDEAARKAMN